MVLLKDVDLPGEQALFLSTYSNDGDIDAALRDALNSAVQRNRLYRPGLPWVDRHLIRALIRARWGSELKRLSAKYVRGRKYSAYESDIQDLVAVMNDEFRSNLCESGFRISHAQKSLSVYLKHLWCKGNGEFPMPPACPVDRKMLEHAGAPDQLLTWTTTNSMDRYRAQLGELRRAANGIDLATWELVEFNKLNRRRRT